MELFNHKEEQWKKLKPPYDKYMVSDRGRFAKEWKAGLIKILRISNKGRYASVAIMSNDGEVKHPSLHRVVAIAFIPNPDNLPEVNHKDGNRYNNTVGNLEWCTHKENMSHAHAMGLVNYFRGKRKLRTN